eukprot:363378-Chlamydomonas_euryale.AAC.34
MAASGPTAGWQDPNPASWAESLVQRAYVDPNDPSTVYISQPTNDSQQLSQVVCTGGSIMNVVVLLLAAPSLRIQLWKGRSVRRHGTRPRTSTELNKRGLVATELLFILLFVTKTLLCIVRSFTYIYMDTASKNVKWMDPGTCRLACNGVNLYAVNPTAMGLPTTASGSTTPGGVD